MGAAVSASGCESIETGWNKFTCCAAVCPNLDEVDGDPQSQRFDADFSDSQSVIWHFVSDQDTETQSCRRLGAASQADRTEMAKLLRQQKVRIFSCILDAHVEGRSPRRFDSLLFSLLSRYT